MKRVLSLMLFVGLTCLTMGSFVQAESVETPPPFDAYKITWTQPGGDYFSTVPMGNGEVGLNAWVDNQGSLRFFISRTDSWDEVGRLIKVGEVAVQFADFEKAEVTGYSQTLNAKTGTLTVTYKCNGIDRTVTLWVDSDSPVIRVQTQSSQSEAVTVSYNCWRNKPTQQVMNSCADLPFKKTVTLKPDTPLTAEQIGANRLGWIHDNGNETPDYDLNEKIQGLAGEGRPNALKNRICGVLIGSTTEAKAENQKLVLAPQKGHQIALAVNTIHPTTALDWIAKTASILNTALAQPAQESLNRTQQWWTNFYNRSWIEVTPSAKLATDVQPKNNPGWNFNDLPLQLGQNKDGGNPFEGTLDKVRITQKAKAGSNNPDVVLFDKTNVSPCTVTDSQKWTLPYGAEFELEFVLKANTYQRLLDKSLIGAGDGFMIDVTPSRQIRIIGMHGTTIFEPVMALGEKTSLKVSLSQFGVISIQLNGKKLITNNCTYLSDTEVLTQSYVWQRFMNACSGRGNNGIMFNGSMFTVPANGKPMYADYRDWGPGYWWQNIRFVYYAMFADGDFDLQQSLFKQYMGMLKWQQVRTAKFYSIRPELKAYKPAYFTECSYFWADCFPETYGWTPWEERNGDPLQSSGYHKREWVGGLELSYMALKYYSFTKDEQFLKQTAIPLANSIVSFFDQYYKVDEKTGKLVMYPAQAVETWWDCTNPMPEIAGLRGVLQQLLALDESLVEPSQRAYWKTLLDKVPPLPTRTDKDGNKMYAPADRFEHRGNIETPEIYCVFPFRLATFDTPNRDLALRAFDARAYRGAFCWRQDDIVMAYLGLTDQCKEYVVQRAREKGAQPFPVFWGPYHNGIFDSIPEQDHGGILMIALQSMIVQSDGNKIYVFPAWPKEWNVNFKLHVDKQTTVSGQWIDGKMEKLTVEPAQRAKDVIMMGK